MGRKAPTSRNGQQRDDSDTSVDNETRKLAPYEVVERIILCASNSGSPFSKEEIDKRRDVVWQAEVKRMDAALLAEEKTLDEKLDWDERYHHIELEKLQVELDKKRFELEQNRFELDHKRESWRIELDQKRFELDQKRQSWWAKQQKDHVELIEQVKKQHLKNLQFVCVSNGVQSCDVPLGHGQPADNHDQASTDNLTQQRGTEHSSRTENVKHPAESESDKTAELPTASNLPHSSKSRGVVRKRGSQYDDTE